mmetsp:Transcript_16532/g.52695  ORF Transcript_16532/g.52695 Transcript_16532/m.52695 type:complete len:883 (-) Transcript_16532:230-2878(-)
MTMGRCTWTSPTCSRSRRTGSEAAAEVGVGIGRWGACVHPQHQHVTSRVLHVSHIHGHTTPLLPSLLLGILLVLLLGCLAQFLDLFGHLLLALALGLLCGLALASLLLLGVDAHAGAVEADEGRSEEAEPVGGAVREDGVVDGEVSIVEDGKEEVDHDEEDEEHEAGKEDGSCNRIHFSQRVVGNVAGEHEENLLASSGHGAELVHLRPEEEVAGEHEAEHDDGEDEKVGAQVAAGHRNGLPYPGEGNVAAEELKDVEGGQQADEGGDDDDGVVHVHHVVDLHIVRHLRVQLGGHDGVVEDAEDAEGDEGGADEQVQQVPQRAQEGLDAEEHALHGGSVHRIQRVQGGDQVHEGQRHHEGASVVVHGEVDDVKAGVLDEATGGGELDHDGGTGQQVVVHVEQVEGDDHGARGAVHPVVGAQVGQHGGCLARVVGQLHRIAGTVVVRVRGDDAERVEGERVEPGEPVHRDARPVLRGHPPVERVPVVAAQCLQLREARHNVARGVGHAVLPHPNASHQLVRPTHQALLRPHQLPPRVRLRLEHGHQQHVIQPVIKRLHCVHVLERGRAIRRVWRVEPLLQQRRPHRAVHVVHACDDVPIRDRQKQHKQEHAVQHQAHQVARHVLPLPRRLVLPLCREPLELERRPAVAGPVEEGAQSLAHLLLGALYGLDVVNVLLRLFLGGGGPTLVVFVIIHIVIVAIGTRFALCPPLGAPAALLAHNVLQLGRHQEEAGQVLKLGQLILHRSVRRPQRVELVAQRATARVHVPVPARVSCELAEGVRRRQPKRGRVARGLIKHCHLTQRRGFGLLGCVDAAQTLLHLLQVVHQDVDSLARGHGLRSSLPQLLRGHRVFSVLQPALVLSLQPRQLGISVLDLLCRCHQSLF